MNDILCRQVELEHAGARYAIATIVQARGTTSRSYGKMLISRDGSSVGTVGGGAVELQVKTDALQCMDLGKNRFSTYAVGQQETEDGPECSGRLDILIEVYAPGPLLVVCGGGHVGTCVLRMAALSGFQTLLFDDRDSSVIAPAVEAADSFVPVEDFHSDICAAALPEGAFFVICGHSHRQDGDALKAALTKNAAYVGMLGSKKKIGELFSRLRQAGVSRELLDTVYTPIGLDLGGETPEEIAVGILAEILKVKNRRQEECG